MKMDKVAGSGNDEFFTPPQAIKPLLKYMGNFKTIWCPFDTDESHYVKIFKECGFNVINTHISLGQDFFQMDIKADAIISNPPYSLKGEVIKSLFDRKIPFAMLLGMVGIFESKSRFKMFSENEFEMMLFDKRIAYFKNYSDQKPSLHPPFSSTYITHKILPKQIIFETLEK